MSDETEQEFNCPFCEGRFMVQDLSILHSLPPCEDYLKSDPLAFLIQVNNKIGAKRD